MWNRGSWAWRGRSPFVTGMFTSLGPAGAVQERLQHRASSSQPTCDGREWQPPEDGHSVPSAHRAKVQTCTVRCVPPLSGRTLRRHGIKWPRPLLVWNLSIAAASRSCFVQRNCEVASKIGSFGEDKKECGNHVHQCIPCKCRKVTFNSCVSPCVLDHFPESLQVNNASTSAMSRIVLCCFSTQFRYWWCAVPLVSEIRTWDVSTAQSAVVKRCRLPWWYSTKLRFD